MYTVIILGIFGSFLSLYHFVSIFLSFPFLISNEVFQFKLTAAYSKLGHTAPGIAPTRYRDQTLSAGGHFRVGGSMAVSVSHGH